MYYSQEQIERANAVDLTDYLSGRGEQLMRSGNEYRWKKHDSLTIRKNKWFRHSQEKGGYPIDFLMEFFGMTFPEAVKELIREDGATETEKKGIPSQDFRLPPRNITNANVIRYLTQCRGLNEEVVTAFIEEGTLYEEVRHHNVVFVGKGKNGIPVYAHCRGTDPEEKFRIDVKGSDKACGFHYSGTGRDLYVFEAPIDLLSFITLNTVSWQQGHYLSLGGIGRKALDAYLKEHSEIRRIFLCLDSDTAGNEASLAISAALPETYEVYRMQPEKKDWNEILTSDLTADEKSKAYQIFQMEGKKVDMLRLSDVELTEVKWLWKPYIPFGKLTILQGNPGEGKTWFAMQLAAACTNKVPIPGMELPEPFNVIYQTAEDGLGDTVKPRLLAAGADLTKVLTIDDMTDPLTLSDDRIERAIRQNKAGLLIIDPIQAFLGANVDMNRANEVRPIFRGLGDVAQRTGCAIILIGHLNKSAGMQSTYRGLGSIDFTACVRSLLFIGKKKEDPNVRVLTHEKSSLAPPGPSLAFMLGDEEGFRWIGPVDLSADEVLSGYQEKKDNKLEQAKNLICSMLAGDRRALCADIDRAAMEKGISGRTVRDAKQELGDALRSEFVGRQKVYFMD